MNRKLFLLLAMLSACLTLNAQKPDPDFFIYLCFGQSNMEAGARPAEQDEGFNDPRFQFMAAVDMPRFQRERNHWYTAVPPICRETNNMGPVDFFGRKMIEVLPEKYNVGVINVSVAGAKLELWDKDACEEYLAMEAADPSRGWLVDMAKLYGMNPYQRLMETAREAQKYGVIKGMLMHQGESNPDDPEWPGRVKKIHDDLCADLGLDPDTIPLLAGELKYAEQDGVCAAFNDVVLPNLPKVMPNAYIISALGCESTGDQFHFSTEGMRTLGYRYAEQMLKAINRAPVVPEPQKPFKGKAFEIPGKIEAEDFDIPGVGSGNDSYKENDSEDHGGSNYREGTGVDIYKKATGYIVGYNQEGEWLEYTVNVKEAGEYTMTASVATANSDPGFTLSIDGKAIAEVPVSGSSWDDFKDVTAKVTLPAGEHILRLEVTTSWFDIDYLKFEKPCDDCNTGIADARLNMPTETESYRIFDMNGSYLGVVSATGKAELRKNAASLVKRGGSYMAKSMSGRTMMIQVAK